MIGREPRLTLILRNKLEEYNTELKKRLVPTEALNNMGINELEKKITSSIQTATKKVCTRRKWRTRS